MTQLKLVREEMNLIFMYQIKFPERNHPVLADELNRLIMSDRYFHIPFEAPALFPQGWGMRSLPALAMDAFQSIRPVRLEHEHHLSERSWFFSSPWIWLAHVILAIEEGQWEAPQFDCEFVARCSDNRGPVEFLLSYHDGKWCPCAHEGRLRTEYEEETIIFLPPITNNR